MKYFNQNKCLNIQALVMTCLGVEDQMRVDRLSTMCKLHFNSALRSQFVVLHGNCMYGN